MNILITGAFGFVGTNLSHALSATGKHRLIALDISKPFVHSYNEFHTWAELDMLSGKSLDTIIHLAGKAHDTKNTSEAQSYFDINVGLTQKIFDFFLNSTATKFILFSSVKAVTDTVTGEALMEDFICNPQTPYGKSKLEAEQYILNHLPTSDFRPDSYRDPTSSKKVYILRPCMIHGPGNKGNLNLLYKLVSKGIPWPLGTFENIRSFTSIGNLQFIIQQFVEKDIEPGTYQVADDEPLSTNEIIQLIAASQNKKARIWEINSDIISFAASVGDKLHLPLNSERLKKLTESYVVSNSKLKKALGIELMPVSSEEGMRRTLGSFGTVEEK